MNKLFTKITSLALGAAMMIGVGVAVSSKNVSAAHAATTASITFGTTAGNTFGSSSKTGSFTDTESNSWAYSITIGTLKVSSGTNYAQIGNSSNKPSNVTFTWTLGQAWKITAMSMKVCSSSGSGSGSVTFTAGDDDVSATSNTYSGTSVTTISNTGLTTSVAKGSTVVFDVNTNNTQVRFYELSVTYEDAGGSCEHVWDSGTVTTAATCTTTGVMTYTCTKCSDTKTEVIDALGHDYGEWIVDTAATCTTAGAKHRVCSRDASHVENESIPATGHTYVDGVCSVCGAEEPEGYTLVTDVSKLVANTTFILLHETSDTVAIGGWSTSYFTTTTASVSGSVATSDTAMVFTLEGTSGAWNIKSGDYYYGIQNSTTALRSSTASGDNYSWTITISNGIATMKSAGSGTRSLCYNGGANPVRYSAYTASSTYTQVRIFAIIPATTKTVTYNANGATDGTVPTDSTKYDSGDTVTVLTNSGSLAKTGFTFNGWNTKNDGSGTHYAASGSATFTITDNTTLYAEWVKTLDAITAIGGSVSATLSNAGTYNWDFSNVTVSGTLSGETGQDVKTYVDLSSTTAIPSSIGSCTVSVTATKKSTAPGSASPLTNNSVSGEVEAPKLIYTVVFDYTKMLSTGTISYANENANKPKVSTATCSGHDDIDIEWESYQVMRTNGTALWMQFQGSNKGHIYNTTEFPGTITDVTLTTTNGSTAPFNTYYGNTEKPLESQTVGGKFFTVQVQSGTGYLEKVTVTFEVSDKPKVQLVASDINADIADGASTPVVTDGTSAVTGYTLTSEDPYVASITNDSKVQPVSYGRVKVSVSKAEDAGHIYLATSFNVIVSDHSKQVSTMEFVEAAGGSATADDGVVWTISANAAENDFSDVYGINFGTNGNKVSSLTMTTPADEERIIKNVVVEAMSATDGSNIAVTVGETSFTCNKSNSVSGNVSTYNFSGHLSGAISITISGTASSKYGVKSISVLYVGDEATSFASTFLGAFSCDASGTKKPTFNKQTDGVTTWTWALLASEYNELGESDKAKFAVGATGVSTAITECVARYDYVVGKYFKTGLDTSFTDFMSRDPSPVGSGRIVLNPLGITNDNPTTVIIIVSVIGVSALGGYFFLRKRKEI